MTIDKDNLTNDDMDDIIVVGPSMTKEEFKAALPGILAEGEALYKAMFIARFVELGIPEHIGEEEWNEYRETWSDDVQKPEPAEAADECMSYWHAD